MLKITISQNGDAREHLDTLLSCLGKNRSILMGKIAKRMEVDLRDKFVSNGGKRFWQEASQAIYKKNTDSSATVAVKKVGVALQYYGGTVRPKNGKNLAIPLKSEFFGRNPREITYKRLFTFGQRKAMGKRYLAYKDGAAIRIAYLLTPKAVIKPHKDKFPTEAEMLKGANETINLYINQYYGLSL